DHQRRVPVEAEHRRPLLRRGTNGLALARREIDALRLAALRLGIDDGRVRRIDRRPESVAAFDEDPIGVGDARRALRIAAAATASAALPVRLRRAAPRSVVLQTAADRVRLVHAETDVVELAEGHVVLEVPRL